MSAEGSHLVWRSWSSNTIWFGLIWFNGFKGEDLNVIFYQNLHNRYKSADRKISGKNVLKSSPLKPVSQYSKHVIDGP
jgi:hypothetical protein